MESSCRQSTSKRHTIGVVAVFFAENDRKSPRDFFEAETRAKTEGETRAEVEGDARVEAEDKNASRN